MGRNSYNRIEPDLGAYNPNIEGLAWNKEHNTISQCYLNKLFNAVKCWTVAPSVLLVGGCDLPVFNTSLISKGASTAINTGYHPKCVHVFFNVATHIYTNACQALGSGRTTAHKQRQNKTAALYSPIGEHKLSVRILAGPQYVCSGTKGTMIYKLSVNSLQ